MHLEKLSKKIKNQTLFKYILIPLSMTTQEALEDFKESIKSDLKQVEKERGISGKKYAGIVLGAAITSFGAISAPSQPEFNPYRESDAFKEKAEAVLTLAQVTTNQVPEYPYKIKEVEALAGAQRLYLDNLEPFVGSARSALESKIKDLNQHEDVLAYNSWAENYGLFCTGGVISGLAIILGSAIAGSLATRRLDREYQE
tara:strand:+ start:181 stop:780 length:600 start_codon:yes stop_codon:yes gene_type:complete